MNHAQTDRTLVGTMPFSRKIGLFFAQLQSGVSVEVEGLTYVWLDNHTTRESTDAAGNVTAYGIDGLALKLESHNPSTGVKRPHYVGLQDMSFGQLRELVDNITEEDLLGMAAGQALLGMNKKRVLKSES